MWQDLLTQADNDLAKLKTLVDAWFKNFENQVTAWYRQMTQFVLAALSVVLAIAINLDTLAATGIPMRWKGLDLHLLSDADKARKVMGWLLTAFALSLGAPFWFDLLQKLSSIRSVGKNPVEREAEKPA